MSILRTSKVTELDQRVALDPDDTFMVLNPAGDLQRVRYGEFAGQIGTALGIEGEEGLAQRVLEVEAGLGGIETDLGSTEAEFEEALDDARGRLDNAEGRLVTAQSRLEGVEGVVVNQATMIDQNAERILLKASSEQLNAVDQRVVDNEASLTVQADEIAARVKQSVYDILAGRVTDAESSIVQNADQIKLTVSQSEYDTMAGRVSDAESSITQNADQIALKVAQTDYDTLTGRVTTAESSITQNADAIGLKVSQSDYDSFTGSINTAVAGLETSVGDIQTNVDGLDDNLASVEQDIGEIGARTVLYANANGNIASLDLLSGAEGSVIDIDADQVVINGTKFTGDGKVKTQFLDVDEIFAQDATIGGTLDVKGPGEQRGVRIAYNEPIPATVEQLGLAQSLTLPDNDLINTDRSGPDDTAYRFSEDNKLYLMYSGQIPVNHKNEGIDVECELTITFRDRDLLPYGDIILQGRQGASGDWQNIAASRFNGAELQQGFVQYRVIDSTYNYDYMRLAFRWQNITDTDSVYFRIRNSSLVARQYETKTVVNNKGIFVRNSPFGYSKLGAGGGIGTGVSLSGSSGDGGGQAYWKGLIGNPFAGSVPADFMYPDFSNVSDWSGPDGRFLNENSNLSDLPDPGQARANLSVYSKGESNGRFLNEASNLSDLSNIADARTNLSVYSKGESDGRFLQVANNLSEITDVAGEKTFQAPVTMQEYLSFADGRVQGDGGGSIEVLDSSGTNNGILRVDRIIVNELEVGEEIDQTNKSELFVKDQYVKVNAGQTGTPTLNGGLYVERGDQPDAYNFFDEGPNRWGTKFGPSGGFDPFILESDIFANGPFQQLSENDRPNFNGITSDEYITINQGGDVMRIRPASEGREGGFMEWYNDPANPDNRTAYVGSVPGGEFKVSLSGLLNDFVVEADRTILNNSSLRVGRDTELRGDLDVLGDTILQGTADVQDTLTAQTDAFFGTQDGHTIGSPDFISQVRDWRITKDGRGDVRYWYADEMRVKAFTADVSQAFRGSQMLTKSFGELASSFVVPSAIDDTAQLHVADVEGFDGLNVFQDGDYVLVKIIDRPDGGLVVAEAWGQVSSPVANGDGTQTWTFTLKDAGNADSTGMTAQKGTEAISFGTPSDPVGFIQDTVLDKGNSPYSQVVTWTVNPWDRTNWTVQTREGNLSGISLNGQNLDGFGAFFRDNLYVELGGGTAYFGKGADGAGDDGLYFDEGNYWLAGKGFKVTVGDKALSTHLDDLNDAIDSTDGNVAGIRTDVNNNTGDIASNDSNINSITGDISGLQADVGDIGARNVLFTNSDGNLALIELLSGNEGSAVTIAGSQVNLQANSDFTNLDDDVSTAFSGIAGLQASVGSIESDITGLDGRLGATESDIGTIGARSVIYANSAGKLASIDLLSGATGSAINIAADQVNIDGTTTFTAGYDPSEKETPQGAQNKVDAVEIGGRNLVLNSDINYTNDKYLTTEYNTSVDLGQGDTLTVTIKGNPAGGGDRRFGLWMNGSNNRQTYFTSYNAEKGTWTETFTVNVEIDENAKKEFRIYNFPSEGRKTATIEWIKMERGNKATDWTPAPEDVQGDIFSAKDDARNTLAGKLGYSDYDQMVAVAEDGDTLIKGGFINTQLLQTGTIASQNGNLLFDLDSGQMQTDKFSLDAPNLLLDSATNRAKFGDNDTFLDWNDGTLKASLDELDVTINASNRIIANSGGVDVRATDFTLNADGLSLSSSDGLNIGGGGIIGNLDGSGQVANGSIKWNAAGNAFFKKTIDVGESGTVSLDPEGGEPADPTPISGSTDPSTPDITIPDSNPATPYYSNEYSVREENESVEVTFAWTREGTALTGFHRPVATLQFYDGTNWITEDRWDGGKLNVPLAGGDPIEITLGANAKTYSRARLVCSDAENSDGPFGNDDTTFSDITFRQYQSVVRLTENTLWIKNSPNDVVALGGGYNTLKNLTNTAGSGGAGQDYYWESLLNNPFADSDPSDFASAGHTHAQYLVNSDLNGYVQEGDSPSFDSINLPKKDLGDGGIGDGIDFGSAGIYRVQQSNDPDGSGLVFYTHPSATSGDPQTLALTLGKFGNADFKEGLSRGGNTVWDAGNLTSPIEQGDNAILGGLTLNLNSKYLAINNGNESKAGIRFADTQNQSEFFDIAFDASGGNAHMGVQGDESLSFYGSLVRFSKEVEFTDGIALNDSLGKASLGGSGLTIDRFVSYVRTESAGQELRLRSNEISFYNQDNDKELATILGDGTASFETIEANTLKATLFKPETIQGMASEFVFTDTSRVAEIVDGNTIATEDAGLFADNDWVVIGSPKADGQGFKRIIARLSDGNKDGNSVNINPVVEAPYSFSDIEVGDTVMRISGNYIYADGRGTAIEGYRGVDNYNDSPFGGSTQQPNFRIAPEGIFYDAMSRTLYSSYVVGKDVEYPDGDLGSTFVNVPVNGQRQNKEVKMFLPYYRRYGENNIEFDFYAKAFRPADVKNTTEIRLRINNSIVDSVGVVGGWSKKKLKASLSNRIDVGEQGSISIELYAYGKSSDSNAYTVSVSLREDCIIQTST